MEKRITRTVRERGYKIEEDRKMFREYLEEIRTKEDVWTKKIRNIEDKLEALENRSKGQRKNKKDLR